MFLERALALVTWIINSRTCTYQCSEMASGDASINVHEHGIVLDEKKRKVKCNYCGKIVSGFSRLKCHLGNVGTDVKSCDKVPEEIGKLIRKQLLESKCYHLSKEIGKLLHYDLPLKRICTPGSSNPKHLKRDATEAAGSGSRIPFETPTTSEDEIEWVPAVNRDIESIRAVCPGDSKESLLKHIQKCIGRFFYEAGIDLSVAKSTSFQHLIDATCGSGEIGFFKVPAVEELKGWILEEELSEIQQYAKEIKVSWQSTGCSILLGSWNDESGKNLIYFLVDCPKGVIFLHACDISAIAADVDALQLIVERVLVEVGVHNVVQVITNSTSGCMRDVGRRLTEKHRTLFWTVSATQCIELILDRMRMMDIIKSVLDKSRTITGFIYSHTTILNLLRDCISGRDLVKSFKIKFVVPFLTLENMVLERKNLTNMFMSPEWWTLVWACGPEGKKVADLVGDSDFWTEAEIVLKGCIPLVNFLCLINGRDKLLMGVAYDAMDQVKETIKREFGNKKELYMPFWEVIDEFWNKYLHNPLCSAGYLLNPAFYYSRDFFLDDEVSNDLFSCISRMSKDQQTKDIIVQQLEAYWKGEGALANGSTISCRSNITPAAWWARYGEQWPELRRLAVRILSQTFDGASRFDLKKDMADKFLEGRNPLEQQRLKDLTFVHYNLNLQQFESSNYSDEMSEKINPFDH